ncbi:MAG: GTPase ObgE [Bacillota bacterium]
MFIDQVRIYVKAGDGGNGMVHFRREKYVPHGGPAGGDGGHGGNVILKVSDNASTLLDLRYRKHHKAQRGENGGTNNMHGKNGEHHVILVPAGTVVFDDDTGQPLADLTESNQEVIIAKGGRGGRGNARFATAVQQAPTFAEQGEPGEERWLRLELKLLADVGLVGFPNAGKSTLLAQVSAAKPKIANYPFTTLVPNLGVVSVDGHSFVMADIPGLIAGAHQGQGLGHEFLRHVERTRLLLHVLDAAGCDGRDPVDDFHTINRELQLYTPELAERPQIVVLNKLDLPAGAEREAELTSVLNELGYIVYSISAATGQGVLELMRATYQQLQQAPVPKPVVILQDLPEQEEPLTVRRSDDGAFVVRGTWIERRIAMTDVQNEDALIRLQRALRRYGVFDALREAGVTEGDTVRINELEFEFTDDPGFDRRR